LRSALSTGHLQRPNSLLNRDAPAAAGWAGGQEHRSVFGTLRSTCSACWPQPVYVALPQVRHVAGLHIADSLR
jgi:hypothetical protein